MRRNQKRGLNNVTVGIIVLVLACVATYLAFTKSIPFRSHFEIDAVVQSANQLKAGSFVRIAGVNVGEVTKVKPVGRNEQAARVTMRISEKGRPIHKDATLKVRPRIVFEGNFFVDLEPGSPSAPELGSGDTIPINQTATPVQFDQILGTFEDDTRTNLKGLLSELNDAWSNGGAESLNRTIPHWTPAYRGSAIVNDAMLGRFEHDLSGYVRGAGRVAEGLDRNEEQLKSLITDLRVTAGAFAERDQQLEQAIAELPRTLRVGSPALAELNGALPSLRRFARELRPGVRSSGPALDAQVPFVRQLRGLVQRSELRGLAADLRPTVPALAQLNKATIPLFEQVRAASSCQNEVILPWSVDKIEDPDFPAIGPVYQEMPKPLIGLTGESRTFDANGQWFRVQLMGSQFATPMGSNRFLLSDKPILGANPPKPAKRSPLRADVPCETQEQPDLRTNIQRPEQGSFRVREAPADAEAAARERAVDWLRESLAKQGKDDVRVVDEVATLPDLRSIRIPGVGG
jgi:phospholipid/cholesterol/gamma-HCH transport system substrate-binding protein